MNLIDMTHMERCLALAKQGWGWVSPNPMVGSVVLNAQGEVVGEGFHTQYGLPHAEVESLKQAEKKARGGTLYVNLEPCAHTGKTPPCSEAIIAAGIKRVVYGAPDPNPKVAGKGHQQLLAAGIEVSPNVLLDASESLNEIFLGAYRQNRPWVTLKLATTLNGKVATRSGESQWLTNEASREYVHQQRMGYDAILTTAATVRADNPSLTARPSGKRHAKQPLRVVLDRTLSLDPKLFQVFDTGTAPTLLVTAVSDFARHQPYLQKGVEVWVLPEVNQHLSLSHLFERLWEAPPKNVSAKVTSIWVEAGGHLAASLLQAALVNKLMLFLAPKVLTDPAAYDAFSGGYVPALQNLPSLIFKQMTAFPPGDVCLEYGL